MNTSKIASTLFAALAIPGQMSAQEQREEEQERGEHQERSEHHHYKLIDRGAFGGALSAIHFPVDIANTAANKRGVTVGYSATSTTKTPTRHPLICGGDDGFGQFVTHAFRWQQGAVLHVGALSPEKSNCSNAYRANGIGEIAGMGLPWGVNPSHVQREGHAFQVLSCDRNATPSEGMATMRARFVNRSRDFEMRQPGTK